MSLRRKSRFHLQTHHVIDLQPRIPRSSSPKMSSLSIESERRRSNLRHKIQANSFPRSIDPFVYSVFASSLYFENMFI